MSSQARERFIARCRYFAALVCLTVLTSTAQARLTQNQLADLSGGLALGARAALDVSFTDVISGRTRTLGQTIGDKPTILLIVDYTCRNVCDPMYSMTLAALSASGLRLGAEVGFVVLGIDPRDDAQAARSFLAKTSDPLPDAGMVALLGDEGASRSLMRSLDYRFSDEGETEGFVHQSAAMLLTSDGRLARVLSPLTLNGADLRLSVVEAGAGRVGTLRDRLTLLCYGFDASKGVYTLLIRNLLSVFAALTIVALGGGILILSRAGRRA